MSASGALVDEVQAARDHAVSGRYEESQAAYEHAIAQIQSLVTAGTGRPWEAVQVELTKESLLVRETALELRRIQLQVPALLAAARESAAAPAGSTGAARSAIEPRAPAPAPEPSPAPVPSPAPARPQHIDHGAAERRRHAAVVQPAVRAERHPAQWDVGTSDRRPADRHGTDTSAGPDGWQRRAPADAERSNAAVVEDPSVWNPPPKQERPGANRARGHEGGAPSWARQVPAQQPRRGQHVQQRGPGSRGPRAGVVDRGERWVGGAGAGNPTTGGPAADAERRRRRPSSGNGDKAWRNGMKAREGRDGRDRDSRGGGAGGGGVRTTGGGAGAGGRKDGGPRRRQQQQYTPLAGDTELAEIIERDVLNRNPVRPRCISWSLRVLCASLHAVLMSRRHALRECDSAILLTSPRQRSCWRRQWSYRCFCPATSKGLGGRGRECSCSDRLYARTHARTHARPPSESASLILDLAW